MDKKLLDYYIDRFKPDSKEADLKKGQENRLKPLIKKLTNKESVFKDFPYELLEMKEKAELLNFLLNISQERQIVSNIGKDNVDRKFDNFLINDDITERLTSDFMSEHPDYEPWDLSLEREKNRKMIRDYSFSTQNVLQELNKLNEMIVKVIFDEVNAFKIVGIGYRNLGYIKDYIDYVSDGVLQFLVYRVMVSTNINDKQKIINNLSEKLDTLLCLMEKQLERKRVEQQKQKRLTSNVLTEYFTAYRTHYSRYYGELDILNTLMLEIEEDTNLFCSLNEKYRADKILLSEDEIKVSKSILTEENSIYEYEKKLDETRKIINIMGSYGGRQCFPNCLLDIKVYFREIFISTTKYKGKQTMTIVRDYLKFVENAGIQQFEKDSHYMFFREKISRGYFREKGLLDLYVAKVDVHVKLYKLLLKTYLFYDFLDSVELIYSINQQILQTFQFEVD
ncbi:hypothetical protein MPH47_09685 [Psychrobacillus psychrodurans]|uniref:hypothetical protein n=1 Tax=Psychrobacillus psychrodurans TaxID=126157 RepID=UPI001F4E18AC|nr:hypothetical protein [Psychrobacillus psychrodurans]MCK1997487.1 hypothetical protein [Psychrobacillus psychrodurans]